MSVEETRLLEVVAAALKVDVAELNLRTSMENTEEWDSLRHLSLVLTIEDEFAVRIPDEDVQHLTSIQLLYEWLNGAV